MTSERNMMDFFLENEEDLEDSTPTPQRQQQCCNAPNIVQMDEHTEQCQNCGAQSMKPRFENQAEESERRGKMEGDIDMQGHAIHNLPEGTRADEPVTKDAKRIRKKGKKHEDTVRIVRSYQSQIEDSVSKALEDGEIDETEFAGAVKCLGFYYDEKQQLRKPSTTIDEDLKNINSRN
ncbi:unnamed protein product [Mytilus coruscus]|uniref:Uncharacterized protein n=1 Tax=Mytilus coruscus TaxID=42192 RepID=A0A6J8C3I6_MYTCO|nr:unnamed protein product [Mytilus coruscus]